MTLGVFLLTLGTIARITRFINADVLFAPVRAAIFSTFGMKSTAADFIECPWCVSVWAGALVTPIAYFYGQSFLFLIPAIALSCSYIYSIAASWLDQPET